MIKKRSTVIYLTCGLVSVGLTAGLFKLLLEKMGYLLCYLEQRQMFLFTGSYFSDISSRRGGFTVYLANFITQFMNTPASGVATAIVCVMLTATCLYIALRKFRWSGSWMFPVLMLISSMPLTLLWHSYGFEVMVMVLVCAAFAAFFSLSRINRRWLKTVIWSSALILGYFIFIPPSFRYEDGGQKQKARFYELEYLTNHDKWDDIISLSGKNPSSFTELNYLNLALARKGTLADKLLFYPQKGPLSLLNYRHEGDEQSMMVLAHILYQAGDYAGAQSLAFSLAVDRNHSFRYPYMVRTVRDVDIIRGSQKTASRYDGMFRKTLHYRDWAETADISDIGRKSFDVGDFFSLYKTPYEDLTAILDAAPENYIAAQYAASYVVLTKDVRMIRSFVERYFDTSVMNRRLPRPMSEALIFYADYYAGIDREFAASHGMGDEEFDYMKELDYEWCHKYGVTADVVADFAAFKELFDRNGTGAPSSTYYKFRNTFWYYLLFVKI